MSLDIVLIVSHECGTNTTRVACTLMRDNYHENSGAVARGVRWNTPAPVPILGGGKEPAQGDAAFLTYVNRIDWHV